MNQKLIFDDSAFKNITEKKRNFYIYEWLTFLDKVLPDYDKNEIKKNQSTIVTQLQNLFHLMPGPPLRSLIAKNIATLFEIGNVLYLYNTIEFCTNIIKSKDESKSQKIAKLCSYNVLGNIFEKLGRIVGKSYENIILILLKLLKTNEIDTKIEILRCIEKIIKGINISGSSFYKELYKQLKLLIIDSSLDIRYAAAKVLIEMIQHASFIYTSELENIISSSFKAFENSNFHLRCCISKLIGNIMFYAVNSDEFMKIYINITAQQQSIQILNNMQNNESILEKKIENAFSLLLNIFFKNKKRFLKSIKRDLSTTSLKINQELNIGLSYAYVEFIKLLESSLLEKHLNIYIQKVLEIVKTYTIEHDADIVCLRKCINHIFRSTIGIMLNEKSQINLGKEIVSLIKKYLENDIKEPNFDSVLVCLLNELTFIVSGLNTSSIELIIDPSSGFLETIFLTLKNPNNCVNFSAAWCLRNLCVSLPIIISPVIEICMNRLTNNKASQETIISYGITLACLLSGVNLCKLGIPHIKIKLLFNIGEELLCTASQNPRNCIQKISTGWMILGAFMTLGSNIVKKYLPRMIVLWKNTMPRNIKELEIEKKRNDVLTWNISLESRSGALMSMNCFLVCCNDLFINDETVQKRILNVIDGAILVLAQLTQIIKNSDSTNMFRNRLYQTLLNVPIIYFKDHFTILIKEIVAQLIALDNSSKSITSLVKHIYEGNMSILLGQEMDIKSTDYQMEPSFIQWNVSKEIDPMNLFLKKRNSDVFGENSFSLETSLIDSSINLLSKIFPKIILKLQLEVFQSFVECVKSLKSNQFNTLGNIFIAVLTCLKALGESKCYVKDDNIKKYILILITETLCHQNPMLRCAAAEAMGRLSEVVSDSKFVTELSQFCFEKLKNDREISSRTGYSLGLGYLHRCIGGLMGMGQNLISSISILFALSQDSTSVTIQAWAIHALYLIADSGGSIFRNFIDSSLLFILQSVFNIENHQQAVYTSLGKLLGAIITLIGPELLNNSPSLSEIRHNCLMACMILHTHPDPTVQTESIQCLQKFYLFSPKAISLKTFVPNLINKLFAEDYCLQKSTISCLRQLCQKEANEIRSLVTDQLNFCKSNKFKPLNELGLEGFLLKHLNNLNDESMINEIYDILQSLLNATLNQNTFKHWFNLCKETAIASYESDSAFKTNMSNEFFISKNEVDKKNSKSNNDALNEENETSIEETFNEIDKNKKSQFHSQIFLPKWPNRVFSIKLLRQIIFLCFNSIETIKVLHFDITLAKKKIEFNREEDYLILHISEIIRVACISSTSNFDPLRISGLELIQDIIKFFSGIKEPEFPDYLILEQYQAPISAALKSQFSVETGAYVTALACKVCSSWISCGVARSINDIKRIYDLLLFSLQKLNINNQTFSSNSSIFSNIPILNSYGNDQPIYSELSSTVEKLAVLRAWAEVYIISFDKSINLNLNNKNVENLLELVQPELDTLSNSWSMVIKDFALLCLPSEFIQQASIDGGVYFHPDLTDSSRLIYEEHWIKIIHAYSIWIKMFCNNLNNDQEFEDNYKERTNIIITLIGICLEKFSRPESIELKCEDVENIIQSLNNVLNVPYKKLPNQLKDSKKLFIDILSVLYRIKLMHNHKNVHFIISLIIERALEINCQILKENDFNLSNRFLLIILEICFHNLIKYNSLLRKNEINYYYRISNQIIVLQEDDVRLLIQTFKIMIRLLNYCILVNDYQLVHIIHIETISLIKSRIIMEQIEKNESLSDSFYSLIETQTSIWKNKECIMSDNEKNEFFKIHQSMLTVICSENNSISNMKIFFLFIKNLPFDIVKAKNIFHKIKTKMNLYRSSNDKKITLVYIKSLINLIKDSTNLKLCNIILRENLLFFFNPEIHYTLITSNDIYDACILEELYILIEVLLQYDLTEDKNKIYKNDLLEVLIKILSMDLLELKPAIAIIKEDKKSIMSLKKLIKIAQKTPIDFKKVVEKNVFLKRKIDEKLNELNQIEDSNKKKSFSNNLLFKNQDIKTKPKIELKKNFKNFN